MSLKSDLAHLPLEREEVKEDEAGIPAEKEETASDLREKATNTSKNPFNGGEEPNHRG